MAGILQSIYSSLTALPHPRQQAEPGKGFLSHWHESQEIWAGCKQHQEQGSTFFQAQPTLAHEGGGTDIWWPKQFLNVVPQRSVSGNWQTVPPDHSWKKWRMIQAGSVFCAHGPPGRCTGITITTKENITVLWRCKSHMWLLSPYPVMERQQFSVFQQQVDFKISNYTNIQKCICQQICVWKNTAL